MIEEVLIIGLAAWRLAALLSYERGPFDVFVHFRSLFGIEHDSTSYEPVSWPQNSLARALTCVWCLGLYMAVLTWGIWELVDPTVVVVIAASGIVVVVEKWNHG